MIELISIHIPKTAGTSFHHVLQQVYGPDVTPALRRRDIQSMIADSGSIESALSTHVRVIHGHFYYHEVKSIHESHHSNLICWLRHPANRVISNYNFFIDRLQHPALNPKTAALNAHRREETLIEYARLEENRNRMAKFLTGTTLESFFFIGFQECFEQDLRLLAGKLCWPDYHLPALNLKNLVSPVTDQLYQEICELNSEDMTLYKKAHSLRESGMILNEPQ